jgi:hypothetical protein
MSQTEVPSESPVTGKVTSGGVKRGRPPKVRPETEQPPVVDRGRIYGPESEVEQDPTEAMPSLRGVNFPSMNEAQLRQFAMQNFGRRFQEGESKEFMLNDIKGRMNVSHGARYA